MGSFGLSDYKEGNYVSKILLPGTHKCQILDLKLEPAPYDKNVFNLSFFLQGEEQGEDFEGLQIDRNNPGRGNYKGQVGYVKSGQFPFKDWVYKGKNITKEDSIQTFLGGFLKQIGELEKFQAKGSSYDSLNDLVNAVKTHICKPDFFVHFTIGAQKYYKDGSEYASYSLFLPKRAEGKYAYATTAENPTFMAFNETLHVQEKKPAAGSTDATVSEFAAAPADDIFGNLAPAEEVFTSASDLDLP